MDSLPLDYSRVGVTFFCRPEGFMIIKIIINPFLLKDALALLTNGGF